MPFDLHPTCQCPIHHDIRRMKVISAKTIGRAQIRQRTWLGMTQRRPFKVVFDHNGIEFCEEDAGISSAASATTDRGRKSGISLTLRPALDGCLGYPLILLGRETKVGTWFVRFLLTIVVVEVFIKVPDAKRFGENSSTNVNGLATSVGELSQRWAVASILLEGRGLGDLAHGGPEVKNEPPCQTISDGRRKDH